MSCIGKPIAELRTPAAVSGCFEEWPHRLGRPGGSSTVALDRFGIYERAAEAENLKTMGTWAGRWQTRQKLRAGYRVVDGADARKTMGKAHGRRGCCG